MRMKTEGEAMNNKCFKYLPDGSQSYLSLNDYIVSFDRDYNKSDLPSLRALDGIKGSDIYAYRHLADEVSSEFPAFHDVEDHNIASFLNEQLVESDENRKKAERILDRLSLGLACMIFSLKEGTEGRKKNELTKADWRFWKSCTHVFFVGRVAAGETGAFLEHKVMEYLKYLSEFQKTKWQFPTIRFCCNETVKTISLMGCAKAQGITGETVYVFDFGNTAIKRGRAIRKGEDYELAELSNRLHEDFSNMPDTIGTAECIHKVIVDTVCDTMKAFGEDSESCEVSICMANNLLDGKIADRGYYKSLRLLAEFYGEYLENELSEICERQVTVFITNDAQAVANLFGTYSPNAAVVTLGTRMGIAYP